MIKALIVLLVVALVIFLIVRECPGGPDITAIEIVPYQVDVGAEPVKTTFQLEARLWTGETADRRSIGEAQGYRPKWSVSQPWLKVKSQAGFKAVIEVAPGAASTTPAFVTVKAGGKTSEGAKISLVPAAVIGRDMLSSQYSSDMAPGAVVVQGLEVEEGPCTMSFRVLVRRTVLNQMVQGCGEDYGGWDAAVLSVNHRLLFTSAAWSPSDNTFQAGPAQLPPRSLPVALRVMVGNTLLNPAELATLRNDILDQAKDEIAAANSILADTRAGIQLAIYDPQVIDTPLEVNVAGCREGDALTATFDVSSVLNVYYVDGGVNRGLTCAWRKQRPQSVIYIGWDLHSSTTFIHELGHALGLTLPGSGHADFISGVDRTNVMTGGDKDHDKGVGRHRLTMGQVFRMNADSASWLNWAIDPDDALRKPIRESGAPRLGCQCGAADPTGHCPRLVDDVARASMVPGSAPSWGCGDLLWLTAGTDEEPVALLAGRRWRAPPSICSPEVRGSTEKHWDHTYVKFDNLTGSGDCPSWVAIFFRQHGIMYLQLPDEAYTWTDIADELGVPDAMLDRIKIDVRVFYQSEHEDVVRLDKSHALETFGAANRSGIELVFDPHPGAGCPTGPPLPLELILCYVMTGNREAVPDGPGRIKISVPHRTPTTASHFIGRALGLKMLTGENLALLNNIMQPEPIKRGKKLTLGQVFRIYAWLNPTLNCDPGPCPALGAVVGP